MRRAVWRAVLAMPLLLAAIGCAGTTGQPGMDGRVNTAALEPRATAQFLDDWVARIALLPLGTAVRQQVVGRARAGRTVEYLSALLGEVPQDDVYGLYIAFEDMNWREARAMPWVARRSWANRATVSYDYHDARQDWYAGAKRTRKLYITEPYFDDGGSSITMMSLARPVVDAGGRFIGVAGADASLEDLRKHLQSSVGEMYLASRAGRVIAQFRTELAARKGYAGEELKNLPGGATVAAAPSGTTTATLGGAMRTLVWATAPVTGRRVLVSAP